MKKPTIYTATEIQKIEAISLALIEEQLEAYNKRDIEAFLKPFSDNIKVFNYPNQLSYEGKEEMRARFTQFFEANPNLHCKTISRTIFKNIVIDKELLTGLQKRENVIPNFIAIYKIASNKIIEMTFMKYLSNY